MEQNRIKTNPYIYGQYMYMAIHLSRAHNGERTVSSTDIE